MAKVAFEGYTHVSKEEAVYQAEQAAKNHGIEMTDDALGQAMYWGYEISLQCELDTETGNVEIVGCDGFQIDKTKKLRENKG